VLIRELEPRDEDALRAFFDRIPDDDRTFFKEDLDEPDILRRWIDDQRGVRLVGVRDDGSLAAIAAVWPGVGRSSHVGDLRLVVAADQRRHGLGRDMARSVLLEALRRGMWKITVEVVSLQQGTVDMFLALGFVPEALLRDHLRGADDVTQDVVLLAHFADEAAQDLALAIPEEAVP
jgi:GNAT superfamily N-acetyltransferase